MQFTDKQTIAGTRRTEDGYLVTEVPVARTGIQIYAGADVGRPDMEAVRVFRSESEVFSKDSIKSYAHKPVVVGHPKDPVTSKNHKKLAVGDIGEEVIRDGERVRVPLMITDEATIKLVEDGTRQLSMGYTANIEFVDGFTPEGEPFDAIQKDIRINHVAIVPNARGGPELKIGDHDKGGSSMSTIKIQFGDASIEVAESSAPLMNKLMADKQAEDAKKNDRIKELEDKVKDAQSKLDEANGEVKAKDKQLKDAQVSDADLDKRVAERAALVAKAKTVLGDSADLAGMATADIQKAVVTSILGDESKDMADAEIPGAFKAFTSGAALKKIDPVRAHIADKGLHQVNDAWAGIITESK